MAQPSDENFADWHSDALRLAAVKTSKISSMSSTTAQSQTGHRIFVVTLAAKAVLGAIQLLTAFVIYTGLAERLPALAQWFFKAGLAEDPNDFWQRT